MCQLLMVYELFIMVITEAIKQKSKQYTNIIHYKNGYEVVSGKRQCQPVIAD
ncbi:hypothetical protein ACTPDI_17335 [Clostridioides difficile]